MEEEILALKKKPKPTPEDTTIDLTKMKKDAIKVALEPVPFGSRKIVPERNVERFESRRTPRTPCLVRSIGPHKH